MKNVDDTLSGQAPYVITLDLEGFHLRAFGYRESLPGLGLPFEYDESAWLTPL